MVQLSVKNIELQTIFGFIKETKAQNLDFLGDVIGIFMRKAIKACNNPKVKASLKKDFNEINNKFKLGFNNYGTPMKKK